MSLAEIAWRDAKAILADQYGPGSLIKVMDPDGYYVKINGFSNDISQIIDPDTGQMFSGRSVTVTVSMLDLKDKLMDIPKGISDPDSKPWRITITDVLGTEYLFKVSASYPDRSRGIVTCDLEVFE